MTEFSYDMELPSQMEQLKALSAQFRWNLAQTNKDTSAYKWISHNLQRIEYAIKHHKEVHPELYI